MPYIYSGIVTVFLFLTIEVFMIDDELASARKNIIPYLLMGAISGYLISFIDIRYKYLFILPTVCILFSAYTDMCIKQIYSFTSMVNLGVGVGFVVASQNGEVIRFILLFLLVFGLFRIAGAINTGDVILLSSLLPYFFLGCAEKYDPYILTFVYILASFIIALIINSVKFIKKKEKSFPYVFPAGIAYVFLIFFLGGKV